jgi:hypothetical protein
MNIIEFERPDPLFKVQKVTLQTGSKITSVVEFNNGYSHIVVDDGCWVVVNGGMFASWIFPKALDILKKLPSNPYDYKPYMDSLNIP